MPFAASAFELNHSEGRVQLNQAPAIIATYDLSVLDTLGALNVEVKGVPQSTYQGDLAKFKDTQKIGTLFEPNFDVLTELKPDLIFAGGRSARAIPELQKHAPVAVFNANTDAFMQSFNDNNLALAKAFGKEKAAKKQLKRINANIKKIQKQHQGQTGAFLFVINNNVMAHAPGDRFGYAYEITGLTSVLPPADKSNTPVARPAPGTPEAKAAQAARAKVITQIAKANPEWLIVLDRGAINGAEKAAAKILANHPELNQTQAFKSGRVFYVDPNPWYVISGGLNNFESITQEILRNMRYFEAAGDDKSPLWHICQILLFAVLAL